MKPEELKRLREQRGYSQAALAEALGLGRRQIIRYEAGQSDIPVTVVMALKMLPSAKRQKKRVAG